MAYQAAGIAESQSHLGEILALDAKYEEAGRMLAAALATRRRVHGNDSAEVAETLTALDDHLAWWRLDTGADISGNGRNLTLTSVTAGTVNNFPVGVFNGTTSSASIADPSAWLNGLTAYSLMIDLFHDQNTVNAGFFRVASTLTGPDTDSHLSARLAPQGAGFANPPVANVYFGNQEINIGGTPTNCRTEGEAEHALGVGIRAT